MVGRNVFQCGLAVVALLALGPAAAQAQSGLLTRPIAIGPITLSAGAPLVDAPIELETGKQYRLTIVADGTQELAIHGPDFFRNVWVNEIVINDIEVRPLGVDSIEFDAAGEVEISFVTIRPGTFELRIPGTTSETQAAVINVIDPMFAPGATGAGAAAEEEEGDDDD
ncbi:MAG: hypothetical protein ACRED5_19300 [Propylenella sp.]